MLSSDSVAPAVPPEYPTRVAHVRSFPCIVGLSQRSRSNCASSSVVSRRVSVAALAAVPEKSATAKSKAVQILMPPPGNGNPRPSDAQFAELNHALFDPCRQGGRGLGNRDHDPPNLQRFVQPLGPPEPPPLGPPPSPPLPL